MSTTKTSRPTATWPPPCRGARRAAPSHPAVRLAGKACCRRCRVVGRRVLGHAGDRLVLRAAGGRPRRRCWPWSRRLVAVFVCQLIVRRRIRPHHRQQRGHGAGTPLPAVRRQPADRGDPDRPRDGQEGFQCRDARPNLPRGRTHLGAVRFAARYSIRNPMACGHGRRAARCSSVLLFAAPDAREPRRLGAAQRWPSPTSFGRATRGCWSTAFPAGVRKVARGADLEVIARADMSMPRVPQVVEVRYRTEGGAAAAP